MPGLLVPGASLTRLVGTVGISRFPSPNARGFDFLSQRAGVDPPSFGRTQSLLHREAWEILRGFTDAMLGKAARGLIHERIGAVWALDSRATDILRRALVLASDHELNASTFATRIAVSTGTPLAAAALAGFAAVVGPLHGLASSFAPPGIPLAPRNVRTARQAERGNGRRRHDRRTHAAPRSASGRTTNRRRLISPPARPCGTPRW
jgi:Citrate synthase, C-terminal domain